MISAAFVRKMARYNAWQNAGHVAAFEALPEADLREDRGAFFGSIMGTANHLLWGDHIWMSRFEGREVPNMATGGGIAGSVDFCEGPEAWRAARASADGKILAWADRLTDAALGGDLAWYSGAAGRDVTKPLALCVVHFFNHQTHHRGQLHTMLTQAGWRSGDTDLFLMPQ